MLSVALVAVLAVGAPALTWDTAHSQADLNAMAARDLDVARNAMESQLTRVLGLAKSDPNQVKRIQTAQQSWEAYRDAQLNALYGCEDVLGVYGSVSPMCRRLAEKVMCERRAAELAEMTAGSEGDVCGWAPTCNEP